MFEVEQILGNDCISKHLFLTEGEANEFLIDYHLEGKPVFHSELKYKLEVGEDRSEFASLTTLKMDNNGKISLCSALIPYQAKGKPIQDVTFYGDAVYKVAKKMPKAWQNDQVSA